MIWSPTVCTGLNAVIGSWGISAISRAADRAHRGAARRQAREVDRCAARLDEQDLAAGDASRPLDQLQDRRAS